MAEMRSDLLPAERIKLERSWWWYLKTEAKGTCPMMGSSGKVIDIDLQSNEGEAPIHICKRKDCIACGPVWRHLRVNHYRRMMDGHVIYYRTVGPEENWRSITTTLTRRGFRWHAPMNADGVRMLFSTCPDQGRNIDWQIDTLLDPRTDGLGMGGRWTACEDWSFERHQESMPVMGEPADGDQATDVPEGKVRVIRVGAAEDLFGACEAHGIEWEFDFEAMKLIFTNMPAVGSTEWWSWCLQGKVRLRSHCEAKAWMVAA